MRKLLFALVLLLSFSSCDSNQNAKQPASDLRFCGRWMTANPNHEYFSLKSDGTYTDMRFTSLPSPIKMPRGISWVVKGSVLYLRYDFNRTLFSAFKVPIQFTVRDTVKVITDSTMVLATVATKKYPSKWISLIKMKEDGKYTTQ